MTGSLFDQIDAAELALVTKRCGFAIAQANAGAASEMVRDPRVSPDGLVAGLCKAHALGLASAIVTSGLPLGIEGSDLVVLQEQLIAASVAVIRDTIAESRAAPIRASIWL